MKVHKKGHCRKKAMPLLCKYVILPNDKKGI